MASEMLFMYIKATFSPLNGLILDFMACICSLHAVAKARGLEFSDGTGIREEAQTFINRTMEMELRFCGDEALIWAEQQEEQRILLANLSLLGVRPADEVGALHYVIALDRYEPPSDASIKAPAVIPLSPIGESEAPVPDPRARFLDRYEKLSTLAARPRQPPGFAIEDHNRAKGASIEAVPTYSWSHSPPRAAEAGTEDVTSLPPSGQGAAELLPPKQAILPDGQPKMPGEGDVLFAPSAPTHDVGFGARTGPHSEHLLLSSERTAAPLDIDEGFFHVMLPDGSSKMAQFSELLELVEHGHLPVHWPAYRAEDRVWLPLVEGITMEDVGSFRAARLLGGGFARNARRESTFKTVWETAPVEEDGDQEAIPVWLKSHAGAVTASKFRLEKQLCVGDEERRPSAELSDKERVASAARALAEAAVRRKLAVERGIITGPGVPPPHLLAAVRAYLMKDRGLIRQVAMGALQGALRDHMEERQRRK